MNDPIEMIAKGLALLILRLPYVEGAINMRRRSRKETRPCEAHMLRALGLRFHLKAIGRLRPTQRTRR